MEPAAARPRYEAIDDDLLVHEWRVARLTRLGIPWSLAHAAAGRLAPGRQAGALRLPATACAPDRPVRQSPIAGSLPVRRLTGDALRVRTARQSRCVGRIAAHT
jgi:hypothetical protein